MNKVFPFLLGILVLAACASEMGTVTGTVFYLPRIALPDDAEVVVEIRDTNDDKIALLGETRFATQGKQIPIAFSVKYALSGIDVNHNYSISAQIENARGNLLFVNDTIYFVITEGNPASDIKIKVIPVD